MGTQLCEYTKKHHVVYFRYINCMVCELYLNKVVTKKTENHARGSRPPGGGTQGHLGGHWEHSRSEHFGIRFQKWGQIDSLNWIRIQLVNFPWATLCGLLSSKDPTCHAFQSGGPSQSGENWSQGWQSTRCKTNSINGSIPKSEINTVDLEVCKQ